MANWNTSRAALGRAGSMVLCALVGMSPLHAGDLCEPHWEAMPGQQGFMVGNDQGSVESLFVWDDGLGGGPAIYATGFFTVAGGTPANYIARWNADALTWEPLGNGTGFYIQSVEVFDAGDGPALYVGGRFTVAGEVQANRLAKWDGKEWSAVGEGMNDDVRSLEKFDDGTGLALYAAGQFTTVDGENIRYIAKWDGEVWEQIPGLMGQPWWSSVNSLRVIDDGTGPALYGSGTINPGTSDVVSHVARWDGKQWSTLGDGIDVGYPDVAVGAPRVFDDGSGPAIYVAANYIYPVGRIPTHACQIFKWDGKGWSSVALLNDFAGLGAVYDDGPHGSSQPEMYVGGRFTMVAAQTFNHLAKWDGKNWYDVDGGLDGDGGAKLVYDDGNGPALYFGGSFTSVGDGIPANGIAIWRGCPITPCVGDFVTSKTFQPPGDGTVDAADLAYLLGEWGANPGSLADMVDSGTFQPPPDGVVDAADLAFLLGAWGQCD